MEFNFQILIKSKKEFWLHPTSIVYKNQMILFLLFLFMKLFGHSDNNRLYKVTYKVYSTFTNSP